MSTRSTTLFCIAGIGIVITAAVLGRIDPVFQYHAVNAGIVVLALLSGSGLLFALITPLLPTGSERPTAAQTTRGTQHTGSIR